MREERALLAKAPRGRDCYSQIQIAETSKSPPQWSTCHVELTTAEPADVANDDLEPCNLSVRRTTRGFD
jgi:hypothetical protein